MPGSGRRWGWHQLADHWAERLVEQARIRPGDLVLDIGAGAGALTRPLLDAGARVIAVELHATRAAALRQRFAGTDVTVVQADAGDLRLPRRPFRVVANPPFAAASPILTRLLHPGSRLVDAHVVLPRRTAERWVGRAGSTRTGAQLRVDGRLPRRAFRPPPRVDVAVLVAERPVRR